jgi:hypothetical protein
MPCRPSLIHKQIVTFVWTVLQMVAVSGASPALCWAECACEKRALHLSSFLKNVPFLGAFEKYRQVTINVVTSLSVLPHGTTRVPMDGFL